jgi:hypothetical protein
MPRGGSKPGERRGGRRKGTLNRSTASLKALAVDFTVEALDVLVATFRDPNAPVAARVAGEGSARSRPREVAASAYRTGSRLADLHCRAAHLRTMNAAAVTHPAQLRAV